MPIVSTSFPIQNDNTPHTDNLNKQIDLALLLSEYYGKNIRQGQTFYIDGVQAWIRWADHKTELFVDTGISAAVKLNYYPTTTHSRRAWNNVFKQWRAQKNLRGGVGHQVRYDDMEFAFKSNLTHHHRTSTIYSTGLDDDNTEQLVLEGNSTDGGVFSLRDYYNSAYPSPQPSIGHFDNMTIKEPKFGETQFPEKQSLLCSAYNSGSRDMSAIFGDIVATGYDTAVADAPWITFPSPQPVMCGLLHAQAYVGLDDTASQIEEDMEIVIAISVKKWKPLVYRKLGGKKFKGKKWGWRKAAIRSSRKRYSRGRKR